MVVLTIGFNAESKSFVFVRGKNVEKFTSDFVSGSGWTCQIRPDGSVNCQATEYRNGKYYNTHFTINKKGRVVMTQMKDGVRSQVLCQPIGKWPADGNIVLTGGDVEERRAFFKRSKNKA